MKFAELTELMFVDFYKRNNIKKSTLFCQVFWVTVIWSTFAYIWLFLILCFFSPNIVEVICLTNPIQFQFTLTSLPSGLGRPFDTGLLPADRGIRFSGQQTCKGIWPKDSWRNGHHLIPAYPEAGQTPKEPPSQRENQWIRKGCGVSSDLEQHSGFGNRQGNIHFI